MGGHQIVGGIGIEGEGQVGDIDKPGRWLRVRVEFAYVLYLCAFYACSIVFHRQ